MSDPPESELEGRAAIVTGGTRGIGRAVVAELVRAGAKVLCSSGSSAALGAGLVSELGPERCAYLQANLLDAQSAERLVEAALARWQRLDILVNCAGISADALLVSASDQALAEVFEVNFAAAFRLIRAAARPMLLQHAGAIVNVSSLAAQRVGRGQGLYAASKAALNALTRAAAVELGRKGIRVNAVAPGFVRTDLTAKVLDLAGPELERRIPLGRFGRPEEIAAVVAFLASDRSAYIHGAVVEVDGGLGHAEML